MDQTSRPPDADASLAPLLAIVCEVAADAARQVDPDTCLRRLRSGLIRLGFSRAGIGVANPGDPTNWHGTWGTDWDGSELDEHRVAWYVGTMPGFAEILNGERLSLYRVATPEDRSASVLQVPSATPGPPNQATVAASEPSSDLERPGKPGHPNHRRGSRHYRPPAPRRATASVSKNGGDRTISRGCRSRLQ